MNQFNALNCGCIELILFKKAKSIFIIIIKEKKLFALTSFSSSSSISL